MQLAALGLEESARGVFSSEDRPSARRCALDTKLGLMQGAIVPEVREAVLFAWRSVGGEGRPGVVRSSALVEDRAGSGFAGQFQSYLGLESEEDFLTAVRACWAALWSTRVLRYMAAHDLDPADTAMAILIQPLVPAGAAGGRPSGHPHGGVVVEAGPRVGRVPRPGAVWADRST